MCSTGASPSAAASAAAVVVLPDPAGPSTTTSRTAPRRGGAARTRAATDAVSSGSSAPSSPSTGEGTDSGIDVVPVVVEVERGADPAGARRRPDACALQALGRLRRVDGDDGRTTRREPEPGQEGVGQPY